MNDPRADSLSGDVEVDGEIDRVNSLGQFSHKFEPMLKPMDSRKGNIDNDMFDPKIDSGIDSMASSTSVSLGICSLSPSASLDSPSSMTSIPEKMPIQCSDANKLDVQATDLHDTELAAVTCGLSKLSTESDDEGICSMTESLSISTNLNDHIIEIDLFDTDCDGDTLIHTAVISKEEELAVALIELAEDIDCLNIQNELFQTPLHLAVLTYQPEVATRLVVKRCDVMCRDKQGNTALHIACRNGDFDIVQTIVESLGNDKNKRQKLFAIRNCEGLTCLHLASHNKQYNTMGYLFAMGADVNMGDARSGRTILHYAAERKDLETVVLLLTHSELNVDCRTYNGETALVLAYWRNYQDIVRKLKKKGAYFSYSMFEDSEEESGS